MIFVLIILSSKSILSLSCKITESVRLSTLASLQCLIKLLGCNQKVGEICVMYHGNISARFKKGFFEAC